MSFIEILRIFAKLILLYKSSAAVLLYGKGPLSNIQNSATDGFINIKQILLKISINESIIIEKNLKQVSKWEIAQYVFKSRLLQMCLHVGKGKTQ